MKRTVTIGLLGAILAITVGFISTNAISATPFFMAASDLSSDESFNMIGHVEYTVLDSNGQIKHYSQGDNLIVDVGRNCSAQLIFNGSDTTLCQFNADGVDDGFNFIAIGNGTFANSDGATQLSTVCPGLGINCGEMDRTAGVVSIASNAGSNVIVTVTTEVPFTFDHAGSIQIQESGLFDDGADAGGNMFANRDVTNIFVTSADTLAVTWTVTLE
jgi:hypothetical protein